MNKLYANLTQILPDLVYQNGPGEYEDSLSSYFSAQESTITPALIVCPQNATDVSAVIKALVQANRESSNGPIHFAIRSGGHAAFAGAANAADGVTIDLRNLSPIEVDHESLQVTIGAGALWGEVYRILGTFGLTVPGGRHSKVGVGGLTLGGGMSHFSARVGFVCDNVLEYELVLASGEIIRVAEDDPSYSHLFQALRGGSNNFGVVTRFVFRAFRQGELWGGTLIHGLDTKDKQLQCFYDFASDPSPDSNASLIQSFGMSAEKGSGVVNSIVYTRPPDKTPPVVIEPFTSIETAHLNTLRDLSLTELTKEQDAFNENGLYQMATATTFYLDLALLRQTIDLWEASCGVVKNCSGIVWALSLHPITPLIISLSPFLRSAVPTLSDNPKRSIIIAQLTATWKTPENSSLVESTGKELIANIEAAAKKENLETEYVYLNYAWPGQNVFGEGERRTKLKEVSRKYDPEGIFQKRVVGGFKLF